MSRHPRSLRKWANLNVEPHLSGCGFHIYVVSNMAKRKKKPKKMHMGTLPGLRSVQTKMAVHKKRKIPKPVNPLKEAASAVDFENPPSDLNIEGVKIWRSTVSTLTMVGELHAHHLFGLYTLAYTWQKMITCMRAGQDIPTKLQHTFNRLINDFGLTPRSLMVLDKEGNTRKNGKMSGLARPKPFEEENMQMEGEDEPAKTQYSGMDTKATRLLG